MDGGWKEKGNDDSMEAVLSEADGGCEVAGAGGKRTGESAIGSADCEVAGGGESEPDKTGGEGGMSAPKISAMENEPRNLTIGTLIGWRMRWTAGSKLNWCGGKGRNRDRGAMAGKVQNPQPLTEGCGARLGLSAVIGACLLRTAPYEKGLGNLPSPQILKEPKSLYHGPSGASGSDSRQSFSL